MHPDLQRDISFDLVRELIARGDEIPLKAAGLSMGHTVRHGESILVKRADPETIRPGDIVLYRIPPTFVAHRVIRRWRDHGTLFFRTKGDGHLASDGPLRGTDVVARVVGVRRGRSVLRFDSLQGRTLSKLLLWHSLAVWHVCRISRLLPRRPPLPRHVSRRVRHILLWPQEFLSRLWGRTVR